MTLNRDGAFSGECCTDCLFLLANGDTPAGLDEAGTAEYLARVERHTAGTEVTLGMFREDHPCRVNFTVTYAPTRYSRRRLTLEVLADDIEDAREQWSWCDDLGPTAHIVGYPRRHDLATCYDLGGECECEQTSFSWSPCGVCGSNLGGARDAVVFWPQPDAQPPAPAAASSDQHHDPLVQAVTDRFNALDTQTGA